MRENSNALVYPNFSVPADQKPLLVLYDLDRGVDLTGQKSPVMKKITGTLRRARSLKIPTAHVFLRSAEIAVLPDECRPRASEMTFERTSLSCFTSEHFERMTSSFNRRGIVLSGFGVGAALASIADAREFGIRAFAIIDQVASIPDAEECFDNQTARSLIELSGVGVDENAWPYACGSTRLKDAI